MKHPMQPLVKDDSGVVRFQQNSIIDALQREGSIDLNALAGRRFSPEDWMQLAQLLGYSVSGFGDLSYASAEVVAQADAAAERLLADSEGEVMPSAAQTAVRRLRPLYEEGAAIKSGEVGWPRCVEWQAEFIIACFEELPHLFAAVEGHRTHDRDSGA